MGRFGFGAMGRSFWLGAMAGLRGAMLRTVRRVPVLIEHFGVFPRMLFTAESGSEGDYQGGKGKRFFHGWCKGGREREGGGLQPGMAKACRGLRPIQNVKHEVNHGTADSHVEPHGEHELHQPAVGIPSVGPARQVGEEDKGQADRGENNVGDQQ